MTSILAALVRLNVAPQKIGFWEIQLERAAERYCYDMDLEDRRSKLGSRVSYKGCCQTNEPKHQYSFDGYVYEVTKQRHSVRAASRFSLNVLRFESDLCELNRL